jgi:hypothetical protein
VALGELMGFQRLTEALPRRFFSTMINKAEINIFGMNEFC